MTREANIEQTIRFQQKIAVALSRWVSKSTRDDLFNLSPGRATPSTKRRRRKLSAAASAKIDESVAAFNGRFDVICKQLDDAEWHAVLYGLKGTLIETWDRPLLAATKAGRTPLCIVKQQKKPELVLATKETFDAFNTASGGKLSLQAMFRRGKLFVYVWNFVDIVKLCDPMRLGRCQRARETIDDDEPEIPVEKYKYFGTRPRDGLDADMIEAICVIVAESGAPFLDIAHSMAIDPTRLPEWRRQGERFLEVGEPPDWEMCGFLVMGLRKASGEFALKICKNLTTKKDWRRWLELAERRMPAVYGKNQPGGDDQVFNPDDQYL